MKKLFSIVLLALFCKASLAQQEVFKIDYTIAIDEDLKSEMENADSEGESITNMTLSLLEGLAGESVLHAWIGKQNYKIESKIFQQWIQLTDSKAKTSFRLDTEAQTFTKLPYDDEPDFSNIKFDNEQTTMIAGFPCKLAILEVDADPLEDTDPVEVEIWYTEKIPQIVWGDYQYLKQIPGAALRIGSDGLSFEAKTISKEKVANDYFEIPENYTEAEEESYQIEDTDLGEGIIAYYDSTSMLFGLKDADNNILTEAIFSNVDYFVNAVAIASNEEEKMALIDTKGNEITKFIYDYIVFDPELNGYLYAKDETMSAMDKTGKDLWANSFESINLFSGNYSIVISDDKYGIVDKKGNIVVPTEYSDISANDSKYFIANENEEAKAYEIKGNKLVLDGYTYLHISNAENLFIASKDGENYGLINKDNKIILPFEYEYITPFSEGKALVGKKNSDEGIMINEKGEVVSN